MLFNLVKNLALCNNDDFQTDEYKNFQRYHFMKHCKGILTSLLTIRIGKNQMNCREKTSV